MNAYYNLLEPVNENNEIKKILENKNLKVKDLFDSTQFLYSYQSGYEDLLNFINKKESLQDIIDIIIKAVKSPSHSNDQLIYIDNIDYYEDDVKYLNIVSEIFFMNVTPFCELFMSLEGAIDKIFECLKFNLNPLVGGLIFKIIISLCNVDDEKIILYLNNHKEVLMDLLLNIENQYAMDCIVYLIRNSEQVVEIAKDQRFIENLYLKIISTHDNSFKIQENCLAVYDALLLSSIDYFHQISSSKFLEYLTDEFMVKLIASHIGLPNINSQIYLFATLQLISRRRCDPSDDNYIEDSSFDDKKQNSESQGDLSLKVYYDNLTDSIIHHLKHSLSDFFTNLNSNVTNISEESLDKLNFQIFLFIHNLAIYSPEKIIDFNFILYYILSNYLRYYDESIYSLTIHESLLSLIDAYLNATDKNKSNLQKILDDTNFIEKCIKRVFMINQLNSRHSTNIKLYQILGKLYKKVRHVSSVHICVNETEKIDKEISFDDLYTDNIIPALKNIEVDENEMNKLHQNSLPTECSFERVILFKNDEETCMDGEDDSKCHDKEEIFLDEVIASENEINHDKFMYFLNSNEATTEGKPTDISNSIGDYEFHDSNSTFDHDPLKLTNSSYEFVDNKNSDDIWGDDSFEYEEDVTSSDSNTSPENSKLSYKLIHTSEKSKNTDLLLEDINSTDFKENDIRNSSRHVNENIGLLDNTMEHLSLDKKQSQNDDGHTAFEQKITKICDDYFDTDNVKSSDCEQLIQTKHQNKNDNVTNNHDAVKDNLS